MAVDLAHLGTRFGAALGVECRVLGIAPLSGGACQENFALELELPAGRRRFALRSDAPRSLPRSLSRRAEYRVIEAAVAAGVKTPAVHALLPDLLRPGSDAYLMDFVEGVAIGRKVLEAEALAGARAGLAAECATELAKIHGVTAAVAPGLFARPPPADPVATAVEDARGMLDELPAPRPALELALRWLDAHRPGPREVVLSHGDFRTGNLLVTPAGLAAVLDWEFAQWAAREEDLAWISVRDWRFGALDRPIGGFADRRSFYEAYARASGAGVDIEAVHWFEIMGNLRWAAGSVMQAERYLSGEVADFELVAIGRRAAEMEFEALRLIERGPAIREE